MPTQAEKAKQFQALHLREESFILPNPWDIGTARLLANMGFEALATTSAGYAFSRGLADNCVDREQIILHVAELATATDLPINADLENGFGDTPEIVAETIKMAAQAGAVGGSIEDSINREGDPIYTHDLAVERVRAAVEAARALPFKFMLTARCENYLHGKTDLADTIKRLQAYQDAGADVLFAPGLKTREDIEVLMRSVDRPVNVMMAIQGSTLGQTELGAMGVKRLSVGGSLARVALGAFNRAARELKESGTFGYIDSATPHNELNRIFQRLNLK